MILRSPIRDVLLDPVGASMGDFLPSQLADLKLWARYNKGITVTGAGVSQWYDASGNGNHLLQGTDSFRPGKQSDGSILFDGVDNYLKAAAFTLVQPETVYILAKQITWVLDGRWFDGNAVNTGSIQEGALTPELRSYAGAFLSDISPVIGTYNIVSSIFNGASSVLQLNNDAPVTGNTGASNMGGFTLAAYGNVSAGFSNLQVKEIVVCNTAHDAVTRAKMIAYLQSL